MSFSQKEITGLKTHTFETQTLTQKHWHTNAHPQTDSKITTQKKYCQSFFSYSLNTELYPLHLFLFGPFSFLTSQLDLHMQSWQQSKFGLFHCRLKISGHMRLETCVWCYFVSWATFFLLKQTCRKTAYYITRKIGLGDFFFLIFAVGCC